MSIKELLTFLSFRSMLLESVSYITDDVMVVLCSDCPLPGSIRVAAWITSSSGSRQRRRDHDGEMVRW